MSRLSAGGSIGRFQVGSRVAFTGGFGVIASIARRSSSAPNSTMDTSVADSGRGWVRPRTA